MTSLAILTIATNRYTKFWIEMYKSYLLNHEPQIQTTFYVFTDQPEQLEKSVLQQENINVQIIEIPSLGWPDATLLRYEVYASYGHLFTENLLMHLDADMLFIRPMNLESILPRNDEMTLVSHPGYWRPKAVSRLEFYCKNLPYLFRDIFIRIVFGGLGTWETSKDSQAFVPIGLRRNYVCGGIWFGPRTKFLELCAGLARRVDCDLKQGIVAKWHDESHLNWWAAHNRYSLIVPSYCFDIRYPQLGGLQEIIRAVDKKSL